MSEVIIPWADKFKKPPRNEKDRIIEQIEERSKKHNAFSLSINISALEWLEGAVSNGVVKRVYTGVGNKIDVVIGVDEKSAQMLADRMR